jgi:hypothetical protein
MKGFQPIRLKILNAFFDKGLTFVVMGFCMWIMYNWVEQGRKDDHEQIKELRSMVEDCAQAKKDKLEIDVQTINSKVDRLLNRQNIN